MPKLRMQDSSPSGKVTFATAMAGVSWIAIKIISRLWPEFIPPEEMIDWQGWITIILVFVGGYFVPPSKGDVAEVRARPEDAQVTVEQADVEINQ